MNDIEKGKNVALISYITIIGSVIAIFMNQEENRTNFASFHTRQALGTFLTFFLLGYPIGYFDNWMVTSSFWVFIFILWLYGFVTCLNGEMKMIPFLGEFFQKFFKNI